MTIFYRITKKKIFILLLFQFTFTLSQDIDTPSSPDSINLTASFSPLSLSLKNINIKSGKLYLTIKGNFNSADYNKIKSYIKYSIKNKFILNIKSTISKDSLEILCNINDFTLSHLDSIFIYYKKLYDFLNAELKTYEAVIDTEITSTLSINAGYIFYLDRKFIITEGTINFIYPDHMNPILDLKAESRLKKYQTLERIEYRILINIQGSLQQANCELQSEPPLDRSDILALLAVGSTRKYIMEEENGQKKGVVRYIIRDPMVLHYGDKIAGYTTDKMIAFLGLDKMTIQGNLSQFIKSSGPELVASKKISDRAELTYSTRVGHLNDQSIRLDYRLSKYFSFEGQTDQKGRSGIDFKYRLRFK